MCVYQLFIVTVVLHNKPLPNSLGNNRKSLFSFSDCLAVEFSLSVLVLLMNLRSAKGQLSGSAGLRWAHRYLWDGKEGGCSKMTSAGMTGVS